jgi:site-specific recombinase XerD
MQTAKIIFYLKHEKVNQVTGEEPIYCRITVGGIRSNISINRWIDPQRWNETNKLQTARKNEDKELILYMESILLRLKQIERDMIESKIPITSDKIKDAYNSKSGNIKKSKSLIEVFEWHNSKFKELVVAGENATGSLDRYKQALNHVKAFLKFQYNKTDIFLDELEYSFITNFDHYLRTERKDPKGRIRKCKNNSAVKYVRNFRKIIKRAVDEGWLKYDPFASYKGKVRETERIFLTPEEISIIENKELTIDRLKVVRDIFMFAIYTGYAYADVKSLTYNHIQKHIDGELWIFTNRLKTQVKENVMLLHPAIMLIEKYKSHPVCMQKGVLFPIPTNQRINSYLKELADVCGINKKLTFHTARHSFATSIMLANGVPMETLMDAIGHKQMKQTQHYAKMLNSKVSEDMKKLNKKFKPKKDNDADNESQPAV